MDVDRSTFAVAIEQILAAALVEVPKLVAVTISTVREPAPASGR